MEVLSRHRLPSPYRYLLVICWLLPILIFLLAIFMGAGASPALFDPRFLVLMALMALPAFYVWQEGIDVLEKGIIRRIYVPRYYAYEQLKAWQQHRQKILIVWDQDEQCVFAYHAAHLTDLPELLDALGENVDQILNN